MLDFWRLTISTKLNHVSQQNANKVVIANGFLFQGRLYKSSFLDQNEIYKKLGLWKVNDITPEQRPDFL